MKVSVISQGKKTEFNGSAETILDVLSGMGVNRETVIVRKGRSVVPAEEPIADGDEIELIKIFSGG
ncbi:MAG: MoaD/ThiS family protein [Candidatus Aenigmarchaeota archaeon]|nr:MoaD/ThiS family protein [Candidatus Aenigmarchaeota archaeon]